MRFIKLDKDNKVIAIRQGESIIEGEIQSDRGELGQIKKIDGTFVDLEVEELEKITIQDKIDFLFLKAKDVI
jgi:hypothetical protein